MSFRLWPGLLTGLALITMLASSRADAYPWMINHGYTSCAACHVDPSGAGQVTAYGRAISDLVVRWHFDPADLESGEPSPTSGFLFGLVPMPEWLEISGNVRGGGMLSVSGIGSGETSIAQVPLGGDTGPSVPVIPLLMATDLRASLLLDPVIVHASVGYGYKRAGPAAAFSPDGDDVHVLTSREHWFGLKLFEDSMMVRAGRMPLPFGLRNLEHTSFIRSATRTDINVQQQHGVSVHFANELVRAEVMAVLGNYQLRPDDYRERGYSGYVELAPASGLTVGASSLLTFAALDIETLAWRMRQTHGFFTRWAPTESMALLAEADALVDTAVDGTTPGGVAWAQLDWQPLQGIHVMPALEARHRFNGVAAAPDLGVWASTAWYALPHTELRADVIYREAFPAEGSPTGSLTALLQLHLFL